MDTEVFEKFDQECAEKLSGEIDKILKAAEGNKTCAIGFITTDDFYGFYLSWSCSGSIDAYYNWENGLEPEFLYQPLAEVVEACGDIDFCRPSDEKWDFALTLLGVLEKNIKQIPDDIFQDRGFRREEILFFAAMSDGDYIQEMTDASVKMFNAPETLEIYGISQQ